MFTERNFVIAVFIMAFLAIPPTAAKNVSTSQSDKVLHVTGWRLPSKIVLRHARGGRPVARQRDQFFAILFAKKLPRIISQSEIRQTKKCKEFLPILQ
jgi:hypothetical protein